MDVARRVLSRDGKAVPLTPKVFDILLALVRHAGNVVTKEELLASVWPDTVVEENSLPRAVSSLRKALGETTSDHRYIVTIPGRGYRFVAAVSEQVAPVESKTRNRLHRAFAFGAILAALPAAALLHVAVGPPRAAPFETTLTTKITSSGKSIKAVLSPDGRYIAYVHAESGRQSLKLRDTESLHDIELVPPQACCYLGVTFSPDGSRLYYVIRPASAAPTVLYAVRLTGGPAHRLKEDLDSPVTFSPDGGRYAFVRESAGESTLIIAGVNSGAETKLLALKLPQLLDYPAWSPTGRTIVCAKHDFSVVNETAGNAQLLEVDVADGTAKLISHHSWGFIHEISWLDDSSGLVLSARGPESLPFHLWLVSYPGGAVRKLTDGLNSHFGASISSDSRQIVTVEEDWYSSLWRLPLSGRNPELIVSHVAGRSAPAWMPNGRILFEQNLNGSALWTIDPDGTNQKRLVMPPNSSRPSVSHDGRMLVCVSNRDGGPALWTMDIDGGNPLKMADAPCWFPRISPDAKWIVYTAGGAGYWTTLWRVGSGGGQAKELNDKLWERPVVSPDGKWIAGFYGEQRLNLQTRPSNLAIVGIEGGTASKIFPIARSVSIPAGIRWTPDGRGLTYANSGKDGDNLWIQPVDGGTPRQVTDFHGDALFGFDWSLDGKQLVFSRGIQARDIVLIRDGRQK